MRPGSRSIRATLGAPRTPLLPRLPGVLGLLVALLGCTGCGGGLRAALGQPRSPMLAADAPQGQESPFASVAASLLARQAWTIRFRRDDHGSLEALRSVYASARAPLWLLDGGPTRQAFTLLATLDGAEAYGLEPRDYDVRRLSALASAVAAANRAPGKAHCGAECRAQLDVGLSAAALALISDLHYGRIDPRAAGFDLGTPRPDDLDLAAKLRALSRSDDVGRAIAATEPQFLHYRLLEQALARYRLLATEQPALAPRVRQIELTLERWRWLPPFQTPPLIVNIPEFRLFAFRTTLDRAASILQMDVIVGRTFPRTRTPVFAADMTSVVFRPYWDVPRSITVREILPKIRANAGYLAAEHLEIVRSVARGASSSSGSSASPGSALPPTPENLDALADGTARLRQLPGPDNALGLIKFDLPNPHDIYLHSTPARQLFGQERRAFSHGCIRVHDPVALAAYVLRDTPGNWTPEKIEASMNGTGTLRVRLATPVRVMILYGTVLAKEDGEVLFFDDLYGQDRRLERLLGLAPVGPARAAPR